MTHARVTTLAELDALDPVELLAGYLSSEKGDPEPGANHTRAYHHGWRVRQFDLGAIEIDADHRRLTRDFVARQRARKPDHH